MGTLGVSETPSRTCTSSASSMAGIHFGRWISIAYLIFKVGRAGAAMEIVAFPKARESANKFYRHRLKGLCVPVCPVKNFCVSRCVPSKNFVCPGASRKKIFLLQ